MNIQECTPLEARRVFRTRPLKNLAIGALAFGAIFSLVFLSLNVLVVGLVALVAAAVVYFYLDSRVIFIECPECRKTVDTSTPWLCGFKECRNENTDEFPFIHECGICHSVPKAYQCHHCGELIFLSTDEQKIHAAKCLVAPKPVRVKTVTVVIDPTKQIATKQSLELQEAKHKHALALFEKETEIIKNKSATPVQPKPEVQAAIERLRKRIKNHGDLLKERSVLIQEARAEFAGDSDSAQHMEEFINGLLMEESERRPREE
jgi:hypothetical protein